MEKRVSIDEGAGSPRGILNGPPADGRFRYSRRLPPRDLKPYVAHFWMVGWDLRGYAPYRTETLPHPNVHVVFESGDSCVNGVHTGRFARVLEGKAHVFGIKFCAGAFRPLLGRPVASITNRSLAARSVIGDVAKSLEGIAVGARSDAPIVEAAVRWLRDVLPQPDVAMLEAGQLVECILKEPEIQTVDALVERSGIGKRGLQRIFREYVGVPPKWVIRRYRLHEVVERMNAGAKLNLADVAADLGYFDQAHLVNDFRAVTGCTPGEYLKRVRAGAAVDLLPR